MATFVDVKDGEKFFVHGGFELQKVNESTDYNCVMVEDPSIGIRLDSTEEVFNSIKDLPNDLSVLLSV